MPKNQKKIFLESEGDAWFERNKQPSAPENYFQNDSILSGLLKIKESQLLPVKPKLLEVGCGEGLRLDWMQRQWDFDCHGIDPSQKAIQCAKLRGVQCVQGTADALPFEDNSVDILVYGFCLYLCDRNDLFKIALEGHRVLKSNGWIVIKDFFTTTHCQREYHHLPGIFSYKMDYRKLFDWHPEYQAFFHEVTHHSEKVFTDELQEWVAVSILRKVSHH